MKTRYLAAAVAVLPVLLGVSTTATARNPSFVSPWELCQIQARLDCYPGGNPPNLGDPIQEAAYEACVAVTAPRCDGLEGDPNNP